jgi:hypothetical protein
MRRALIAILLLTSTLTYAQTPSGPANGKSCSQLAGECVAYNKARGDDTGRCAGYKQSCIATGTYQDRNRTITGAKQR